MYKLKQLTIFEFDNYSKRHPLRSYFQTSTYAMFLSEQGYDYELIGLIDENNKILAASLIAIKKINILCRYAYAPRGFLIDYYNKSLLKTFIDLLKKRYYSKNVAYIKINPEISIANINIESKMFNYTKNKEIENILKENNFIRIEEKTTFSNILPRYNAILLLKAQDKANFTKTMRNKINKSLYNGLTLEKKDREDIKILYDFVKYKEKKKLNDYYNLYNSFSKQDAIDIFLVKINFEESLINERKKFEKENLRNQTLVEKLMKNNTENNLKNKLNSDRILNQINENIAYYTQCLAKSPEEYIAGAIIIKYQDRIYVVSTGYNKKYKNLCPNYFLHYELIKYYHKEYNFFDLNGISGKLVDDPKFKGLNEFKLGFKPKAFELIGEYNLPINDGLYKYLESKNKVG